MAYLLGLDIGTSGTKALLIRDDGKVVASAMEEYPLLTPKPGWAEQDPAEWVRATVATIRKVLADSGARPADIQGVGLSGQMHGSVFLDESQEVIRPALLWCDARTAAECDEINATVGAERFHQADRKSVV